MDDSKHPGIDSGCARYGCVHGWMFSLSAVVAFQQIHCSRNESAFICTAQNNLFVCYCDRRCGWTWSPAASRQTRPPGACGSWTRPSTRGTCCSTAAARCTPSATAASRWTAATAASASASGEYCCCLANLGSVGRRRAVSNPIATSASAAEVTLSSLASDAPSYRQAGGHAAALHAAEQVALAIEISGLKGDEVRSRCTDLDSIQRVSRPH